MTTKVALSGRLSASERRLRPKITLFHCYSAVGDTSFLDSGDYDLQGIKMPCSSMTREGFLLRAFEAGADAVIVMVCPEGSCRYLEGNVRAARRVARTKRLLDEIGIDGRRLNIFQVPQRDRAAIESIITETVLGLDSLGPNPAA